MSLARYSTEARNAKADALARLLDGGFIDLYTGSMPATPNTAITSQVKLSRHALSNPSAPAASSGVVTFSAIGDDTDADADGTATWARAYKSNGTSAVCDFDVGTSGTALIMATNVIAIHSRVQITALTYTEPMEASG
jgi:hypothetical protein